MSKRKDQEAVIFRLPANIKKKLQMRVLEEGTSIQELLEDFVYDYLGMKGECKVKKNWIELLTKISDYKGMELWQAICHDDGHEIEGWALVGEETADFYDTNPRELPEEELTGGYRLPSYMPGHRPQG